MPQTHTFPLVNQIPRSEYPHLWDYSSLQQELGATATIVNFGDTDNFGALSAATGTGAKFNASGLSPVWTPNAALSTWATPPGFKHVVPIITFDGTSNNMTTPDATYWTRALAAMSVGAWVNLSSSGANRGILAKYTTAGNLREWIFRLTTSDSPQLILYDEDDAITPNGTIDTYSAALALNTWYHVVFTYDGTANASGIDAYINGALVASTDTDDPNFASMRNYTSVVELGSFAGDFFWAGKMAGGPCGPFFVQAQLTAAQIANLYRNQRLLLGL